MIGGTCASVELIREKMIRHKTDRDIGFRLDILFFVGNSGKNPLIIH